MLGKITHWLATRYEDRGSASDLFVRQRYEALSRLKNATLAVLRKENAVESGESVAQQDGAVVLPREQRQPLTERDSCVNELCLALEECLVLGIKQRNEEEEPSWWHVLYASTLIVDEPTLVQSVLSAAFLSETDAGKARCWLKIALNNHTVESSIMIIFSMACEHLINNNYEDWSLVRCSEGLGLFLELIIALREVHFGIEVSDEAFHLPEPDESVEIEPVSESGGGDMVATITDADIAAAVGVSPSRAGSFIPPPETQPLVEVEEPKNEEVQDAHLVAAVVEEEEEAVLVPSNIFPHRIKGVKPWQYVFGVSLASLAKNPFHSRYALIDPWLAVPNIVADCVEILRQNPDTPRLFRATVLSIRLNHLREIVETDGSVPKDLEPQCAAALLLDFLKNLPDPLLTDDKYDAFVAAGQLRDEDASVRNITCLVNDLPVHCGVVLKKVMNLIHFLQQPEHAEHNGVDVFTASTALTPVIAFKKEFSNGLASDRQRSRTHSQYDVRYAAVGAQVVERMIQHYPTIFHDLRVHVCDALEGVEAKKEALRMVSHQLKLQPQMSFLSDRQQINEITRLFRESLEAGGDISPTSATDVVASPYEESAKARSAADLHDGSQFNSNGDLELDVRDATVISPVGSPKTSGTISPTFSEISDQDTVGIWEQFGFNRPSVLGNFEKGGVLMLRAIHYWLKNDANAVPQLKMRALPSELPSYDAGLVASSICESVVKLLNLLLTPKHPEIDIIAMSLEPFWEIFDEEGYFNKLFMFMFQMFDQLWSELDPKAASFTRVINETEEIMGELLKKSPVTVNDLRTEWEEMRTRRVEELEQEEQVEKETTDDAEAQATSLDDPALPPMRYSKKRPSFDVKPEDFKAKLLDPSSILTLEHIAYLDHALPITSQLCRWFKIYSVEANGSSLETLLILAKKQSPTLLVVKDADGNVFGGFASDEWHHAFHYYGTGESFLFSFANPHAAGGFVKYQWSRKNSYFMLCSEESLIMGGGGNFGLFLDSDLSSGTSGACETFNSPPLTTSQEFICVHVELWGFTVGDKPVEIGERHRKSVLE